MLTRGKIMSWAQKNDCNSNIAKSYILNNILVLFVGFVVVFVLVVCLFVFLWGWFVGCSFCFVFYSLKWCWKKTTSVQLGIFFPEGLSVEDGCHLPPPAGHGWPVSARRKSCPVHHLVSRAAYKMLLWLLALHVSWIYSAAQELRRKYSHVWYLFFILPLSLCL